MYSTICYIPQKKMKKAYNENLILPYQVRLIQEVPSEPAGIRHATLRIDGNRAYGWCKAEAGVHRLVRISPFDSSSKRHTSFAQVRTFPVEVGGDEVIKILPSDVRVDTFRAQGAGGQHVNTTER